MKRIPQVMFTVLASLVVGQAAAQADFPAKPVRMIVNFATGGPSDIVARILSAKLTETWGKPVVVENITGFSGNIGAERAAKATPDGYTLLLSGSSPIVINPSLYEKLPYNPLRELAPVSLVCTIPNLLVVHPAVPAKSVQEFVVLAKAQPGRFTFASSGAGSASHLSGELFKAMAGLDIRHIPYKGTGATLPDLLSGRVTMTVAPMAALLPLVREGKLRALGVASAKRSPAMADLPTIAESGYPGFDTSSWQGALAPAATPAGILRKLNLDIVKVIALPEVRTLFTGLGMEPVGNSPQEFALVIKSDVTNWAKVIRDSGAKPE